MFGSSGQVDLDIVTQAVEPLGQFIKVQPGVERLTKPSPNPQANGATQSVGEGPRAPSRQLEQARVHVVEGNHHASGT